MTRLKQDIVAIVLIIAIAIPLAFFMDHIRYEASFMKVTALPTTVRSVATFTVYSFDRAAYWRGSIGHP